VLNVHISAKVPWGIQSRSNGVSFGSILFNCARCCERKA